MPGQTKISSHDKYILVKVEGDPLAPKKIESILLKVTEQAVKSDLNIIIFREMPVKQRASVVDFYYYAKSLSKSAFRNKLALTFPREMHYDNLDFFENTCVHKGINMRLFCDIEDALKWLGVDDN